MGKYMDTLLESGCDIPQKDKVCRSRGGDSCAFDGAMIVLQPIADTAHLVHGPIACFGNSWEGRGTLSNKGSLHKRAFTTDMNEIDIVYGSGKKLHDAIVKTFEAVRPEAIFVYATCVSGLIGEDLEAVCKKASSELGLPVIPVNAPGFTGPKNLGNRIAGEALLDHVIGTGEPPFTTGCDINLIGEYNIAGDLWLVEPLLKEAGVRVLSRITGDSSYREITYAHRAKLNVIVCSRALINIAGKMERNWDIPYIEVSFFGKTEMSGALRQIGKSLGNLSVAGKAAAEKLEAIIAREESRLDERLRDFRHLRGKKALLYAGGVKSWSFISALMDLGIEVIGIGTKKSTREDEEKMKMILGENAPLIHDVAPKNLIRVMKEKNADMLIAGSRNLYVSIKEGFPFVDINQERHHAYAGYAGLLNFAEQISNSMKFYGPAKAGNAEKTVSPSISISSSPVLIDPLKHSAALGAAMAFQGIDRALPLMHGTQGCSFLAKVLLTKHFREPVALASTKLYTENVVMGSDENLINAVREAAEKQKPDIIAIITSGLSEIKGDDVSGVLKTIASEGCTTRTVLVSTPDYMGGLETGYGRAVETIAGLAQRSSKVVSRGRVNVFVGHHLGPADFSHLREMIEAFGLVPVMVPDLAAMDGSRQGISGLASGGTGIDELRLMGSSEFTIAVGTCMEGAARLLRESFGIEYRAFESLSGLNSTDSFLETLALLGETPVPERYLRQRAALLDGMRDAHFYYGGKRVCLALEPDHAVQTSCWLSDMGADIPLVVVPSSSPALKKIVAEKVAVGGYADIEGDFDLLVSNSHGHETAQRLGIPLYEAGFPSYRVIGAPQRLNIGYQGTLSTLNHVANMLMNNH